MPNFNEPRTTVANQRLDHLCLIGLALFTLICLWPVGGFGFIGYDDLDYVYQNPQVQAGLTLDGLRWAFATATVGMWHPVTWLSHMMDCELFGLDPHEEHWVNLALHTANTLLLFILLQQWTNARWRSVVVAALFAAHPLHIQSVAWISERKDVLSGFFGMLTLLAYTRYSRSKKTSDYLLMLALFVLGLMSKTMLITLPIILFLLDFWPLGRVAIPLELSAFQLGALPQSIRRLLTEKIPLAALCVISAGIAVWSQRGANAMMSLQQVSLPHRILHACCAYSLYLGKLFWPVNLAIFYPYPRANPPLLVVAGAVLLLVALPLVGWRWRRTQPSLLIGWLWFFIMLLPVIGIAQIGSQSIADRYTYLPAIGIFLAATWIAAQLPGAPLKFALAAATLLACGVDTRHQLTYWRGNIALFSHVVEVSPENDYLGYFYLGLSQGEAKDLPAAEKSFKLSLEANPAMVTARSRLGNVLYLEQKFAEADSYLREVSRSHPENISAHLAFGMNLAALGRYTEAQAEFAAAQRLQPGNPAIDQLIAANAPKAEAQQTITRLAQESPTNSTAAIHIQIAQAQDLLGNDAAAVKEYDSALNLDPNSTDALNNLAWLLATCPDASIRDGARAVRLAEKACALTHEKKTIVIGTLAAAYAEAGRFDDAIATAQKACANAAALGESDLLAHNQALLAVYQSRQAWHQTR